MDIQFLLFLQSVREALPSFVTLLFTGITFLGEPYIPLIGAFLLYWCFDKRMGRRFILISSLADFWNGILKITFCVYRPWVRSPEIHPAKAALSGATGYSFPSGHSSKAVAAYGALWTDTRKKHRAWNLLPLLIALVLFSRCFLGCHTLRDVLAGLALGVFTIWSADLALRWSDAKDGRDIVLMIAGLALCLAGMLYAKLRVYPMDYDASGALLVDPVQMRHDTFLGIGALAGMLPAFALEKRYVRFTTDGTRREKTIRFGIGFAIVLLLYFGVRKLLQIPFGRDWGAALGAALCMFFAVFLYPLVFTKFTEKRRGTA